MKKFSAAALLIAIMTISGGCSFKKTEKAEDIAPTTAAVSEAAEEETTTEAASSGEKATEPPAKDDDQLKAEPGKYVYDLAHLMTDEQKKSCEEFIGGIYTDYMLNAAVVTVSDLKNKAPYTYAAEAYFTIYGGEGNGLLLLINNDTNEDHLYKTGVCTHRIGAEAEKEAFFTATRDIVNGDYTAAVTGIMGLGKSCPERVFDEAEAFSNAEVAEIDKLLSSSDTPAAIAAIRTEKNSKNVQTVAKELFERHFPEGKGIMIAIDTVSKKTAVYSPEQLPASFDKSMKEADEMAAKSNWAEAAKKAAAPLAKDTTETTTAKVTAENN
ncbi:MAG: TPM domain-containing protein [Ruminococcus sp.]|nr:TPM domain-containing protein [Ruminococcus sp.]